METSLQLQLAQSSPAAVTLRRESARATAAAPESQVQVAADIERILREATAARDNLAKNCASLEESLDLDKQRQAATAEAINCSHEALEAGRVRLREVHETIGALGSAAAKECRERERKQMEVMHDAAGSLESHVQGLSRLEVLHMPRLVKGLGDPAARLRGGRFVGPPPRLPPTPLISTTSEAPAAGVGTPAMEVRTALVLAASTPIVDDDDAQSGNQREEDQEEAVPRPARRARLELAA